MEGKINVPENEIANLDMSLFRSFMEPPANSASQEKIVVTLPSGKLHSDCNKSHETACASRIGQITQKMVPPLSPKTEIR